MCGIVGYVGSKNKALETLIDGLEKLEYRGYDSAGIAFVVNNNLNILKSKGKIVNLKEKINFDQQSNLGIGHTRWATHGEPNEKNSHPHKVGKITIVHNGIIENYVELKQDLIKENYLFNSDTDTEVACALLNKLYNETNDIKNTIDLFQKKVRGAYALGILCEDELDVLYAVKKDSPLIIGIGNDENYIASDVPAILKYTNKYLLLDDFEYAKITNNNVEVFNNNQLINKKTNHFDGSLLSIDKNGYDHYMLKEINEQPDAIKNTISDYIENDQINFSIIPDLKKYNKIVIIACGSAMHAGLVGKNLIEEYASIPVEVEIASEFRYKNVFIDNKSLVIAISQSGETADTLAAIKKAKEKGSDTLGIINAYGSSIARNCDYVMYTKAGNEIAVATTKAYTAQVVLLSLLAFKLSNKNIDETKQFIEEIKKLPIEMQKLLDNNEYKKLADKIYNKNDIFFLGRKIDYALSMEGSLKLKEISYIHSEAYPAGELKHGTISLIDKDTPIISIVTDNFIAEKTISNMKEVKSRGANVITITTDTININEDFCDEKIVIPTINKFLQPLLTIIPLQLISYEIAKKRNCDIDKPKNLAKSVTVE